jgi:hypothetical protein
MKYPDRLNEALEATRANYRVIHVGKHIYRYCGVPLHVATEPFEKRKPVPGEPTMYRLSIIPAVYAFCSCAQWIEIPEGETWEDLARIYYQRIVEHDSDRHIANMLRGQPTTDFIRLILG